MKKEKCGDCLRAVMIYDRAERDYRPYCLEYNVWLLYDQRYSLNLETAQAYKSEKCIDK